MSLMPYTRSMSTFYGQTDSRWANLLLGYNTEQPWNIGNYGCLVTGYGNMLVAATGNEQYTPVFINQYMKDNNGFLPGGGTFIWTRAAGLGGVTAQGTATTLAAVKSFLAPTPNFAILEVTSPSRGQHFVMANTTSTIIDSEDGKQKSITTYPFVAAHLYTATNMPQAIVASLATSGTLDATAAIVVDALNCRTEATTASPVAAVLHKGTAHVTAWMIGQTVTVNGRTDNVWLRTDAGHWFSQAGTSYHE